MEDHGSDDIEMSLNNLTLCASKTSSLEVGSPSDNTIPLYGSSVKMPQPSVTNSESDSDELPDYWVTKSDKASSVSMEVDASFTVEDILLKRKKDQEWFVKLKKLDDEEEFKPKMHTNDNLSLLMTEDEDVKFLIDASKNMKVLDSNIKKEPHYVLMNPECSFTIFDSKMLKLEHFVPNRILKQMPKLLNVKFDNLLTINTLQTIELKKEVEEGMCTLLVYLMSVNPDILLAESYFQFLRNKPNFYPSISDFINIFQNWGFELVNLYKIVPDIYTGLRDICSSSNCEKLKREVVREHNFCLIFQYLKHVLQLCPIRTYRYLIEPLMRMIFDVNIYDTPLKVIVAQVIWLLIDSKTESSEICTLSDISVKDVHRRDFTLQHQTIMCTKILRNTNFALPLGYAALQQFLGNSNIIYCQYVKLDEVYGILIGRENIIEESSLLDVFCYLQIIDMFLCQQEIDYHEDDGLDHEKWISLLHNWSLQILGSENSADPIYVKEKIAQVLYQLRMKQVIQVREQRNMILQ